MNKSAILSVLREVKELRKEGVELARQTATHYATMEGKLAGLESRLQDLY